MEATFQAVHKGSVRLRIIPADPSVESAVVNINIEDPASIGNSRAQFDPLITAFAHKRGIPPQFIKGQIERESGFNARSWRYEPIASDGDLGQVSRGRTPPLREVAPFSSYRLATAADDGALAQGHLLLQADIAPRGEGRFPLMIRDPITGQARAIQLNDPNPTARELYEVNNVTQHWTRWARRDVLEDIRRNPEILEFVAQTPIASSYGLLQILYPTAILEMQWPGVTAGGQNPAFLFDTAENQQAGGGSLELGTAYFVGVYVEVNSSVDRTAPQFVDHSELRTSFIRGFNRYNHKYRNPDDARYSTDRYGTAILGFSEAYLPVAAGPIFR